MGNVTSGGGKYFAGKFKLGKIEGQLLAGDEKAGFGPSKPCPPGEDCSDTESTADTVALDEITPSGGVKTNKGKQGIRDLIKSQREYDKNTAVVSQELAESDSLIRVAKGGNWKKSASTLYGRKYNSSMPLTGENIGDGSNSGWGGGLSYSQRENIGNLRKKAKKIQGPRPTL